MAVMTGIMIAGLALQAYGAYKAGKAQKEAGKAQKKAADSQAELAEFNAAVADVQSEDATLRGEMDEQRYRGQVRVAVGAQRVGFAGANIDVNYGSAVDVQADAAIAGEHDALTIRTNARREAWGYEVTSTDYRKRAEIARKEGVYLEKAGNSAGNAAYVAGAANVIGGTGSLLAARYGFGGTKASAPSIGRGKGG